MSVWARLATALGLELLFVCGLPSRAATPATADTTLPRPASTALFGDDDLLLFQVTSSGVELSDGMSGYSSRAGLFLPLGELSRLLDLAIQVDPATGRAEGWFLSEERSFALDLRTHRISVAGRTFAFAETDAALFH